MAATQRTALRTELLFCSAIIAAREAAWVNEAAGSNPIDITYPRISF